MPRKYPALCNHPKCKNEATYWVGNPGTRRCRQHVVEALDRLLAKKQDNGNPDKVTISWSPLEWFQHASTRTTLFSSDQVLS